MTSFWRMAVVALLGVALPILVGCSPSRTLRYTIGARSGHPTMTLGSLTLVFEAATLQLPDNPALGQGTLMVGGNGTAKGNTSVQGIEFAYSYAEGATIVQGAGSTFRITDSGSNVEFGNSVYPIDGTARTVIVGNDGTPQLQNNGA
jgi:hypothetical protein